MHKETQLATLALANECYGGIVNIPVTRASTMLFPTLADFEAGERGEYRGSTYGRNATPISVALEAAIAELEHADHAIVTSSGLAAITTALLAFTHTGDHILVADSVYGPTRRFCDHELARFGVEITYYDPNIGDAIHTLLRPNTKLVFIESPGSLTFEVQDVPAIARRAHAHGAIVIGDNTWGTPLYLKAFELGMDISIHSATKYISGHSDLVMGTIACKEHHYKLLLRSFRNLGCSPSADNCYLALRGLRTMALRLKQHQESALKVAAWLESRPEVEHVYYPALPGSPGHELWRRDFSGACGLFAFALKPVSHNALAAMLDGLEHFGMGYSWGGFESLIIPLNFHHIRTATSWPHAGQGLRMHIGLEHADDLIADLQKAFARLT